MTDRILSFYRRADTDDRGRMLDEIRSFDLGHLESVHDYIQWLFPLAERSGANGLPYEGGPITRVPQMVQETGGIEEDICTNDWGTALEQLGNVAFGARTVFPLTAQPADPSTIAVGVADQPGDPFVPVPSVGPNNAPEWSYDSTTNAVVFDPLAAPEPGEVVQVTYTVACN